MHLPRDLRSRYHVNQILFFCFKTRYWMCSHDIIRILRNCFQPEASRAKIAAIQARLAGLQGGAPKASGCPGMVDHTHFKILGAAVS